jgi:cobalt-precorrin-5B (C1)-methyltransferase
MSNKILRTGFTTGTCAAGAVRGAAALLFEGKRLSSIPVALPDGKEVILKPHRLTKTRAGSFCSIIKDAGDDPDITDGAVVTASVSRLAEPRIRVEGGQGVGRVTRRGLQAPVGEAAINPVPRKMIEDNLHMHLPPGEGARVIIGVRNGAAIIGVRNGAALAKRTFNPRLGIVGGLSILGTTGIVEPKSADALKTSLTCALDIAKAENHTILILVPGHIGERGIKKQLKNKKIPIIQMSNFVGFMLKECRKKGFNRIILAGHPGKLVKLIGGDFDTHSSRSSSALPLVMEEIKAHSQRLAVGGQKVNTVEEMIQILKKSGRTAIFSQLACKISRAVEDYSEIKAGVVLLSMDESKVGSFFPDAMMETYFG